MRTSENADVSMLSDQTFTVSVDLGDEMELSLVELGPLHAKHCTRTNLYDLTTLGVRF